MNNIDVTLGSYFESLDVGVLVFCFGVFSCFFFFFAFYILKLVNKSSFEILFIVRSKIQWPTTAAAAATTTTTTAFPVMLAASTSFWTTSKCKRVRIKLYFHTQFGI